MKPKENEPQASPLADDPRLDIMRRRALLDFVCGCGYLVGALGELAALLTLQGHNRLALGALALPLALVVRRNGFKYMVARKFPRRYRRLTLRGVPVNAYLVQANGRLFRPGSDSRRCLALISFQDSVAHNSHYMLDLAQRVSALNKTRPVDRDLAALARFTKNDRAVLDRRRRLPLSFTGGYVVYCADLWIDRVDLPQGYLTDRLLPCIAEPGDRGAIELLPPYSMI